MSSRRPCVRVPLRMGEQVRRMLLDRGLLDTTYQIRSDGERLALPLSQSLSLPLLSSIVDVDELEIGEGEFLPVTSLHHSLEELLCDRLTPDELKLLPRAYDLVGDIAVLDIPATLATHERAIGQAFHKLHRHLSTVLVKRGAVSGTTRVRQYECLSGLDKTDTIHTEYGCRIAVDLAKAYFSPRLLEEHNRVAGLVQDDETVLDMFTGVGPFALHIAKRTSATVYAVDINPDAIALLVRSIGMNKLVGKIQPFVGDVREFVSTRICSRSVSRVIMNHPSQAARFMGVACSALQKNGVAHYYDFLPEHELETTLEDRVLSLVSDTGRDVVEISSVRKVRESAPYEYQVVADIVIR
ncbi:MAG: class I SAM-dependent methyltransferase family protein [Candidatus Thorarchaeota archaeon]|nr:class I SAM-dependent methyltransferase family protein [Candidatus Thorarchaeota archaeon]